jgi:two-component system, chemotaxis family, response regulator Rcp1
VKADLHTVVIGEQALEFLTQNGCFSNAPNPILILMGLTLAEGGREMVFLIKNDPHFARIPLIVFASPSDSDDDIKTVHSLGANCCVRAPSSPSDLVCVVEFIKQCRLAL